MQAWRLIEAGTPEQVVWNDDNWIFLDIGFSGKKKSCGLAIGNDEAACLDFAEAQKRILAHLGQAKSRTCLMIEAPLSVAFRNGLPVPRSIEKRDGKNRYWYVGAGCAVMVATMYLIRAITDARPANGVRLYEALISFKKQGARSHADHAREAEQLRYIIRKGEITPPARIVKAAELGNHGDKIKSAFSVVGIDCGVPAVLAV